MKKAVIISVATFVIFSCTSNDKKTTTDDTKNSNQVGVPNVNGNIPDTTNSINLGANKKDSATTKDSAR